MCVFEETKGEKKHEFFKKGKKKELFFFHRRRFIHNDDGDLDFTSDALELHTIREAKQRNELHPIHIKGTENIYSRRFHSNLHFLSVMLSRIECILNCTYQFLIV